MSSIRDIDAAQVDQKDGKIMLGDWKGRESFHISEVDTILQRLQTQRAKVGRPVPDDMKKAMHYCKRFKPLRNESSAGKAKEQVLRRVEINGSLQPRCHDFEASQLLNLMPSTAEEAKTLIPTLENNPYLEALVKEIQPMRDFDRGIGYH